MPMRGLVSTIPASSSSSSSTKPPILNWIFVDPQSLELKYGSRADSTGKLVGSWDWTEDEVGLTLEGWEGFFAVEEKEEEEEEEEGKNSGVWALYFDREDDGLKGLRRGRRGLRCSLERRVGD